MVLLTRKRQLAIDTEATPGTFETALNTDATARTFANFYLGSPSITPGNLNSERDAAIPTLTPLEQFAPGVESVELSFGVEIAGARFNEGKSGTADYVEPPYAKLLSYCGWRSASGIPVEIPITSYDTGSVVKHRERLTEVIGGTKKFDLIGTCVDGLDTELFAEAVAGVPVAAEQYDGGDTGARITIGAPTSVVFMFHALYPVSDVSLWNTASFVYYADKKRWKVKGARGTPEFVFEHGKPARINFRMLGIVEEVVDGDLLDSPLIAQATPPPFLNNGLKLHDGTSVITAVVHNALSFSQNNQLVLRENSSDPDGWSFAGISSRGFTGSLAFDERLSSSYDFRAAQESGTPFHARMQLGTANSGLGVSFRMDGVQLRELVEGDRDGVTTWQSAFDLRSRIFERADDATPPYTLGEDNEVVILNT